MIDDSDHYEAATGWAVRVGVAFVFVLVGLEKVQAASAPSWIQIFDAIGFGQWFRYFTAIVECLGGLLFLIPAATTIGAAMLASAMVGAMIACASSSKRTKRCLPRCNPAEARCIASEKMTASQLRHLRRDISTKRAEIVTRL